jgi:TRAP-type mannitol/chloroaromatic compound transport system permease small subunit
MSQPDSDGVRQHSVVEADFVHHTGLPTTRVSRRLDGIVLNLGFLFAFLWLAVVATIIVAVVGRYAFGIGSILLEEIEWHLAGAAWLVGLSYTLVKDSHVRVDVLYERFGLRRQVWIELIGILVLLLPFAAIVVYQSWPFFWSSYLQGEVSSSPAGLPARWAIKFFVPFSFALILLAAVSRLLKCTALLFGVPTPAGQDDAVR